MLSLALLALFIQPVRPSLEINDNSDIDQFMDVLMEAHDIFLCHSSDCPQRVSTFPADSFSAALAKSLQGENCKSCIEDRIVDNLKNALCWIQKKCETAQDCPAVQAMCKWKKENEAIAEGLIVEMAKIPIRAMSFCFGKGSCGKKDQQLISKTVNFSMKDHTSEEYWIDVDYDKAGCLFKYMKRVMEFAVSKAEEKCKMTKCPVLKEICEWARVNKEPALGILIGKVEPWKFAMGKCLL